MRFSVLATVCAMSIGLPFSCGEKILLMIISSDPDDVITSGRQQDYVFSGGQKCSLQLTNDGNLRVEAYHPIYKEWDLAWESGSAQHAVTDSAYYLHLQKIAGNLVIYKGDPMNRSARQAIWASNTGDDDVEKLYMNHDCILTLEEEDGTVEWRTTKMTRSPTTVPSLLPSFVPSAIPTFFPSIVPTLSPTRTPSSVPTRSPSNVPSFNPTAIPSISPSFLPSSIPSQVPTFKPFSSPSSTPTMTSVSPSLDPTSRPSYTSSQVPTLISSSAPTMTSPKVLIMTTSSDVWSFIPSGRIYQYIFGDRDDHHECRLELTHDGNLLVQSLSSSFSSSNSSTNNWGTVWKSPLNATTTNSIQETSSYFLYLQKKDGNLVIDQGLPTMDTIISSSSSSFEKQQEPHVWSTHIANSHIVGDSSTLWMDHDCILTLETKHGAVVWSSSPDETPNENRFQSHFQRIGAASSRSESEDVGDMNVEEGE